ncbi:MAG: hypothetical protein ACYDHC_04250 [Desulfuromonadaceae bacterium]
MPLYSLKLSTYDPEIIDAFERLRKSRKQATFTHEAIKQFLSTERGKQVLANMDGVTAGQQLPVIPPKGDMIPVNKPPDEPMSVKSGTGFGPSDDYRDILSTIFE